MFFIYPRNGQNHDLGLPGIIIEKIIYIRCILFIILLPSLRWLDQGEEDGKIVRELCVSDNNIFAGSKY